MAIDRRTLSVLQQLYPQIPATEFERIAIIIQGFAGGAGGAGTVAPAAPPRAALAPPRRGRPPRGRRPKAAVAAPPPGNGDPTNADAVRALLNEQPMTAKQVQEALGLKEGAAHPLLARVGAVPVGEFEVEPGIALKTYGFK